MGGFAASCYKRGIDFIQVLHHPTSHGRCFSRWKTRIDLENFKNQIGLFKSQKEYIFYQSFTNTKPKAKLSGYAEIIKHALIADKDYWQLLMETSIENINWEETIHHSVTLKMISLNPTLLKKTNVKY